MILTGLHDEEHNVDESKVKFARPAHKPAHEDGNSWVLWSFLSKVKETIAVIGPALELQNGNIKKFALPNTDPIWINAKEAEGPIYMPPGFRTGGGKCWIAIGGKNIGVSTEPAVVAELIRAAGGTVRPIIEDSMINSLSASVKEWFSPSAKWDDDTME